MNDEPRVTRKLRRMARRGRSRPGGVTAGCGCRFARMGGAWLHVWMCPVHELGAALTDTELISLMEEE